MLGFLWMSEEDLGFDPPIQQIDGERFIETERDGRSECIVIDGLIIRKLCMVGRATTCGKAHVKDHSETPLVIKDSWQLSERDEEGEMLKQATGRNVVNVARYYHHETVRIGGMIDDRSDNKSAAREPYNEHEAIDRSNGPCLAPKQKVHRQVIVQDYGKAIDKASSRKALLFCLEGCFKGHKSLYDKGILHRGISINNLMINEDQENPFWR
ncbi:hypothetical protein E4U16_006414 [Claviceps sp. LM84 group G4]|nr:hypothetical protein E4U33_006347 [Claviceps sp. LM78 group G4]KAG6071044.1 hypothetical protein E4U16_006414 [Claviceps sp. LM84 group G4]